MSTVLAVLQGQAAVAVELLRNTAMYHNHTIGVIIPAYNEEHSIRKVLGDIPDFVDVVVVVDNNSTDTTAAVARSCGAIVVFQPLRGYGNACLKGMEELEKQRVDITAFLDGDYSDYPEELELLIVPIITNNCDFVVGSRITGKSEDGALLPQAIFGNWLSTKLIRLIWGYRFTDLGPFRAIRSEALRELKMEDKTFGWTVEMQIKAAKHKLKCTEIPVRYRKRIGESKISGTVKGSIKAGYKILWTIFRHAVMRR